jgi:hypothetical protein
MIIDFPKIKHKISFTLGDGVFRGEKKMNSTISINIKDLKPEKKKKQFINLFSLVT